MFQDLRHRKVIMVAMVQMQVATLQVAAVVVLELLVVMPQLLQEFLEMVVSV
jgi:hypothetical protein